MDNQGWSWILESGKALGSKIIEGVKDASSNE